MSTSATTKTTWQMGHRGSSGNAQGVIWLVQSAARAAPAASPSGVANWRRPLTSVYREINPHTALRLEEALHGLFDAVVGMS